MNLVSEVRDKIYNHFQSTPACFDYISARPADFAAYTTSMFLIQDATDALIVHRRRGFSDDGLFAYIEFWGVMQAVIIQQDAIVEVHRVLCGRKPTTGEMPHWLEIREMRNQLAGHPALSERDATNRKRIKAKKEKNQIILRSFMGRDSIRYTDVDFEQWVERAGRGTTVHAGFDLGAMLDRYAGAAEHILMNALQCMQDRWPSSQ